MVALWEKSYPLRLNVNVILTGRREEGKDTLATWHALQRHSGIVVFDVRGLYDGFLCWGPEELQDAIDERRWSNDLLIYRFDSGDVEEEFEKLSEVLFPSRMSVGGFGLIISEAGDLQTANSINPSLKRALGQHKTRPEDHAVTIYQCSHRLAEFHGKSKALIDELYIFDTQHPRDLEAIVEYTQDPQVAEVVSHLPPHHVVRVIMARMATGKKQWEILNDPSRWYVKIGKDSTRDAEARTESGTELFA